MKYSLKDVINSLPKNKRRSDSIWTKIWGRPLGNLLAWIFVNMGLKPNFISLFVVFLSFAGFALCCINNYVCVLIGLIVFNFFIVFDCVDGTMARTLKTNSYMGEFFDAIGGYTMCLLSLSGAGISVFNVGSASIFSLPSVLPLILGCIGGACDIFSRLVYQKYTCNIFVALYETTGTIGQRENDAVDRDNWKKNIFLYLRLLIDGEFGTGGLFPVFLLIGYIFGFLDLIVILYAVYHILAFLLIMIVFLKKASTFDKKMAKNNKIN